MASRCGWSRGKTASIIEPVSDNSSDAIERPRSTRSTATRSRDARSRGGAKGKNEWGRPQCSAQRNDAKHDLLHVLAGPLSSVSTASIGGSDAHAPSCGSIPTAAELEARQNGLPPGPANVCHRFTRGARAMWQPLEGREAPAPLFRGARPSRRAAKDTAFTTVD